MDTSEQFIADRRARMPNTLGMAASKILDNPERRHEADGFAPVATTASIVPNSGTRTSVLTEAQGLVHGGRNEDYGHPLDDWTRTAGMVSAMLAHKLKEPITAEDALLFMVCVKASREINKPKRDNRVDGAGYFECLDWVVDERKARAA